jgi:hypothetical protein
MANTEFAKLPALSNQIYKEWYPKTVLVQSCDSSFEGELNLETRELDIPVYHDLSIHTTTIKERDLKPAPIEFVKASTKRVTIDKGRYSHWGQTNLSKLLERLSAEDSEVRKKLVQRWAIEAEKELAAYVAFDTSVLEIDLFTLLGGSTNDAGLLKATNITKAIDILKAKVMKEDMNPAEFTLFVSERFEQILRDTQITFGSEPAAQAFRQGFIANVLGVDVRHMQVEGVVVRDTNTAQVKNELAIWKTMDGIQYVVPYKNTISYEIMPDQVLMGGQAYQTVEYYDFFNLYPKRLYRVKIKYEDSSAAWKTAL